MRKNEEIIQGAAMRKSGAGLSGIHQNFQPCHCEGDIECVSGEGIDDG